MNEQIYLLISNVIWIFPRETQIIIQLQQELNKHICSFRKDLNFPCKIEIIRKERDGIHTVGSKNSSSAAPQAVAAAALSPPFVYSSWEPTSWRWKVLQPIHWCVLSLKLVWFYRWTLNRWYIGLNPACSPWGCISSRASISFSKDNNSSIWADINIH